MADLLHLHLWSILAINSLQGGKDFYEGVRAGKKCRLW